MKTRLITYRTPNCRFNQHAVIPELYLPDLLGWLKLSAHATIVRITDNPDRSYRPYCLAPRDWPSYRACNNYIQTVCLLGER